MRYRADIDGLRALAILPVVLCHLGVGGFAGGYVGVDVFFVISGYLISRTLFDEMAESGISLTAFYERRVRRIIPAFFSLLAACFIAAWVLFLPSEMRSLSSSLVASALSYSNIHFYLESGYFDAASSAKPLLHTWSLAVEEQFYLLFPLLLIAAYKLRFSRKRMVIMLSLLFMLSFCASVYGARERAAWAFYLPHSRAWELLAGAFLAIGIFPEFKKTWQRQVGAAAGMVLILFAVFTFTERTHFPGHAALLPVLGAMLLIHTGNNTSTWMGQCLSSPLPRFIGLVSYSWYLWHWPIMVFYGSQKFHLPFSEAEKTGLFVVSFLLAVISWWFIEKPFRSAGGIKRFPRRSLFNGTAVLVVILVGIGALGVQMQGLPQRFPSDVNRYAAYADQGFTLGKEGCFIKRVTPFSQQLIEACVRYDPTKKNYLLVGDSHAAHLFFGFKKAYPEYNFSILSMGACKPVEIKSTAGANCDALMRYILHEHFMTHPKQTVILAAKWFPKNAASVEKTVKTLQAQGIELVIVGPQPAYSEALPLILAKSLILGNSLLPDQLMHRYVFDIDEEFAEMAARNHVPYISPLNLLCAENGDCMHQTPEGAPLLRDNNHLSAEGTLYLGARIRDAGMLP
ncbi:MAG: acyltransferase [Alphaproteobacteria bacterium]|nr:acyltransferase [Alphaproteobacteria bacterium]